MRRHWAYKFASLLGFWLVWAWRALPPPLTRQFTHALTDWAKGEVYNCNVPAWTLETNILGILHFRSEMGK